MPARVRRGSGPKGTITEWNVRKKSLPHLMQDFAGLCAYCLDPSEFRHPIESHVEHFDCRLRGQKRNRYSNLMLACAACNISKKDKPVHNPENQNQRLLNCTVEDEFQGHICEDSDGAWSAITEEGKYHLTSIDLQHPSHTAKRKARRDLANRVSDLLTTAIQYKTLNSVETHDQIIETIRAILAELDGSPPLVTDRGVFTVRSWLVEKGITV